MRITGPAKRVYGSLSAVPDVSASDVQDCLYAANTQDCFANKIGAGLKEQFLVQGLPFGGGLPPDVVSSLPGCLGSGGDLSKCSNRLLETSIQLGPAAANISLELLGQISHCNAISEQGVIDCLSTNATSLFAGLIDEGKIVSVGSDAAQKCLAGDPASCGYLSLMGIAAEAGGPVGGYVAATMVSLADLFSKLLLGIATAHGVYPSEMVWQDIQNASFTASGMKELMSRIADMADKIYGVYGLSYPWPSYTSKCHDQRCTQYYDPNSGQTMTCHDPSASEIASCESTEPVQNKSKAIWDRVRTKYAELHPDLVGGPQEVPEGSLYDTFFFTPGRGIYDDIGTNQDNITKMQTDIKNWFLQTVIPYVRDAAVQVTKDTAVDATNASAVKSKLAGGVAQLNAQRQVLRQQKWNADEAAIIEKNKQGVWATDQQAQAILAQNKAQAAQIQAQAAARLNDALKKHTWAKDFAIFGLGAGALLALMAVISEVTHGND